MNNHFSYRRLIVQNPLLNSVIVHSVFWTVSYLLLSIIIFFTRKAMIDTFSLPVDIKAWPFIINSSIVGFLFGVGMGVIDHYFEKYFMPRMSLGTALGLKTILALILLFLAFSLRKEILFDLFTSTAFKNGNLLNADPIWKYLFYSMLIYTFIMSMVINFMRQVNKKFGPGILLPLLLGRYRNPREEERILMFMDLKSSTTIAESLGHLKFSALIRDAFMDVNQILIPYNTEIYQYVGDEIILSWKREEGLRDLSCVSFFFDCKRHFDQKADYYTKHYGTVPEFKASLHIGKVTVVEIGDIKKDIAFHGDTMNTAARIQELCSEYNKRLLISDLFNQAGDLRSKYKTEELGNITLKGKKASIGIFSVED